MHQILLVLSTILSLSAACLNETTPCSGHGLCIQNSTCKCDYGYIKWPRDNSVDCNYLQKKAGIPFACHVAVIGLFTGIGPFLLGRDDWGAAEILLFWLFPVNLAIQALFVCFCSMFMVTATVLMPWLGSTKDSTPCETCFNIWNHVWVAAIFFLWLTSLILIGGGYMQDGNGAPIIGL